MIITVTLNAAIDKSLSVPSFQLARRHRSVEQRTMPGGKGVNVARTLKTLGQPVIATGFEQKKVPQPGFAGRQTATPIIPLDQAYRNRASTGAVGGHSGTAGSVGGAGAAGSAAPKPRPAPRPIEDLSDMEIPTFIRRQMD